MAFHYITGLFRVQHKVNLSLADGI